MFPYADTPALRTRQLLGDLVLLLWCALWARVAVAVHRAVDRLGAPGRELQEAGAGLRDALGDAASRADGVPLVGRPLRAPLDAAAAAGDAFVRAGAAQEQAVGRLALLLTLLAVLPALWAVSRHLPARLAWARRARAARQLAGDVDLLALRAAAGRPLAELAALGPDPVGRWRRGEPGAAQALAALELAALGLAAPQGAAPAGTGPRDGAAGAAAAERVRRELPRR